MSQTHTSESVTRSTVARRINFSDGNRALHVQALFAWLPEELQGAPGIDWTRLPSQVIGYLVNTVDKSPWASSLALAAAVSRGAKNEYTSLHNIRSLNQFLRDVQSLCRSEHVSELTKQVWESYVTQKDLTPGHYHYFKIYAMLTESHLPDHLELLTPHERAKLAPYVLPPLPRGFRQQHFPDSAQREGEKQRRKEKSDVLAPLHSLLVALVRFRKQSAGRLLSAYHEALEHARREEVELLLPFSYEEELVMINRDARTVAEVQLEKRPITLRFLLWDRRTWMLKHPNDYHPKARSKVIRSVEEFTEPQFFVQCLNPAEELLWFGDLIKYRLLQRDMPMNIAPEDGELRQQILTRIGTGLGMSCSRAGILTPRCDFTNILSHTIYRTSALVFDVEALCRGVLFASALATIALTNGSRLCELLQVSADRFKVRPYVAQRDGNAAREERVMHLQLLLPKGKHTEAERKLFPISDWSWDLLREIVVELKRTHQGHIPVIRSHPKNTKAEALSPERYLFQWDASPDGKLGAFDPQDVACCRKYHKLASIDP